MNDVNEVIVWPNKVTVAKFRICVKYNTPVTPGLPLVYDQLAMAAFLGIQIICRTLRVDYCNNTMTRRLAVSLGEFHTYLLVDSHITYEGTFLGQEFRNIALSDHNIMLCSRSLYGVLCFFNNDVI